MVANIDYKQTLRALREEMEKSQDIIDANTIDWSATEIDPAHPGSFSDEELTDARNATSNLESPFDKKDEDEDKCDCNDPECDCHHKEEPEAPKSDEEEEAEYDEEKVFGESVVKEATMSDIPHEIDDPIHCLRDIIFRLEETKKNWELSGIDTAPLDDIIENTNNLIECMYVNGAKLGDDELVAKASEEKAPEASEDEEEEAKEDEESEEKEEKEESSFDDMIRRVLTERGVTNQYNGIMKNVTWVEVMNAIKEKLEDKYGRSIVVNQVESGEDHAKAFEVSTNGQDIDLPKTLNINDVKLKLDGNVYKIED